jgi:hypothetical protein
MKNWLPSIFAVSLVVVSSFSFKRGFADQTPQRAPAPVKKVFVPEGFDDNDNTEVILHGNFPNSCMKQGPVEFSVEKESRRIIIRPEVYVYSSNSCYEIEVPFVQRVALGNLSQGVWMIEVDGGYLNESVPLSVERSTTAAPDDFLYAPVEDVVLLPDADGASRVVVSGRWPEAPEGRCFQLKEVITRLGRDHVLVVLPIAELKPSGECRNSTERRNSFSGKSIVKETLPEDLLIHVRVLNGESLNKFHH